MGSPSACQVAHQTWLLHMDVLLSEADLLSGASAALMSYSCILLCQGLNSGLADQKQLRPGLSADAVKLRFTLPWWPANPD